MSELFSFQRLTEKDDDLLDVVFVHGLGGDPQDTWSNPASKEAEGPFWPSWLNADIPNICVYTLGYPSSWFVKWAKREMDLYERAKQVLEALAGYGLGKRPLALVCHSLGGLLAKQLVRTALESQDESWISLARAVRAIFFIATPHSGLSLANTLKHYSAGLSSSHIDLLVSGNSELTQLNEACRNNCDANGIAVHSYYEMYATNLVVVVDKASADPGIGRNAVIPIDADHIAIAKPIGRHSTIYLSVMRKISQIVSPLRVEIPFEQRSLIAQSDTDRRDLLEKLTSAGREHEFRIANDAQTSFARNYTKTGLLGDQKRANDNLLQDVEDRFNTFVYLGKICRGGSADEVDQTIQKEVVDPLVQKYTSDRVSPHVVRGALYFLGERCHVRWDPE